MRRINQAGTSKLNNLRYARSIVLAMLGALLSGSGALAAEPTTTTPARRTLIVSLPDRKLALVEDGRLAKVYDIAVGAPWSPSPTGDLHVINKVVRPTYYHRGVVIGPGRRCPIGPRWIGLSRPGYGIHGTNEPRSIGKAASHGCLRMRNDEVQELFTLVQVGDAVEIHRSRDEVVSRFFPEGSREVRPAKSASPARQAAALVSAAMAEEL
jgi:lipoprotein-anchoring transpeptidase ErfK/SrfK